MTTKILFRKSLAEENEFATASRYFEVIESRSLVRPGDKIICRYSALPYYEELEKDVLLNGGQLINSFKQHRYVADIENWYWDLEEFTPKTYFQYDDVRMWDEHSFVVKGRTNSRKHRWSSHMFARSRKDILPVMYRLEEDQFIDQQGLVIREYERFVMYDMAINGLPITKEFRFFVFKGQIIAAGFYWSNHPEVIAKFHPNVEEVPKDFLSEIAEIVSPNIDAWVMDIAQHEDGRFRLVELNDFQMSGLSCIASEQLYSNLKKEISEWDRVMEFS